MYVWNDIARRYFGLEGFGFNQADHKRIWNAWRHHRMPRHEIIVLMSTMDNALVRGEDRDALIEAFEQYGREHPNSSLAEQAAVIREAELRPGDFIGWCQTSVSEFWGMRWNEDKDEAVWYDPTKGDRHFDVFSDARAAGILEEGEKG